MQITQFDRDAAELVSASVKEALAVVAEKHGVRVEISRTTYRADQYSIALAITPVKPGTAGLTREAEAFIMGLRFPG